MVKRCPAVGACEITAERKRAGVPSYGILGDVLVDVFLDELRNAVVVEIHWRVHAVAAVKTAGSDEPVVTLVSVETAGNDVLGNSMLAAFLGEREIVVFGEVLIPTLPVVLTFN